MTVVQVSVRLDLRGLDRFRNEVSNPQGPIRGAFKQWAVRYRAFVQRRFSKNSRGSGEWPPLKHPRKHGRDTRAAAKKKRQGKQVKNASILYDTGTLFRVLNPVFQGDPGALQKDLPLGVEVGYGGPARHKGSKATIAEIAMYHDQGMGRLPKRSIIVPPPEAVLTSMARDMERALQRLADQTINRP